MLLKLFKSNNPSLLLPLLFYVLVLKSPIIFTSIYSGEHQALPAANLIFGNLQSLSQSPLLYAVIGLMVIIIQGLIFSQWINRLKFFPGNNYIPAICFFLISSVILVFNTFSPELLVSFLFLFFFIKLFDLYKLNSCYTQVFDLGLIVGISSIIYQPALSWLILLYIGLSILRPFNWREWLIAFFGVANVFFLTWAFYFVTNADIGFFELFISPVKNISIVEPIKLMVIEYPVLIWLFVGLMLALLQAQKGFMKSPIHIRKYINIILLSIIIVLLSAFLADGLSIRHFVILTVPLSIIIGYLFTLNKRIKWIEAYHWVFVLLIIVAHYWKIIN